MESENKVLSTTDNPEAIETESVQEKVMTETNSSVESKPEEKRCPNCQALLVEEKTFCPECGVSLKSPCVRCGAELNPGQFFCPECGAQVTESNTDGNIAQYNKEIADKQRKKGKHKKLKIILSIILMISIVVGGYFGYIYYLRQQVLGYAAEAEKYIEAIEDTKADLSIINEAWDIVNDGGSWLYYGTVKSYARSMFSANISSAKSAKPKIEDLYKNIEDFKVKDSYVDKIKSKAKEVQDIYLSVYDSVIVSEVGYRRSSISDLSNEVSELKTIVNEIKSAYGRKK